jgi:hypothetical protein
LKVWGEAEAAEGELGRRLAIQRLHVGLIEDPADLGKVFTEGHQFVEVHFDELGGMRELKDSDPFGLVHPNYEFSGPVRRVGVLKALDRGRGRRPRRVALAVGASAGRRREVARIGNVRGKTVHYSNSEFLLKIRW